MSKLTKNQKQNLKMEQEEFMWNCGAILVNLPDAKITVAAFREFKNAKMLCVAVSVMSDDEPRFRGKVGKFQALDKINAGEFMKFPVPVGEETAFIARFERFWDHAFSG